MFFAAVSLTQPSGIMCGKMLCAPAWFRVGKSGPIWERFLIWSFGAIEIRRCCSGGFRPSHDGFRAVRHGAKLKVLGDLFATGRIRPIGGSILSSRVAVFELRVCAGKSAIAVVPLPIKVGTPFHIPSWRRSKPKTSMYHCAERSTSRADKATWSMPSSSNIQSILH